MYAQYYDLNIWGEKDNTLFLTAYEWEINPEGYLQINTKKYRTQEFTDRKDLEFLLDDLWLNNYPFTDYDEWKSIDDLYNSNTPKAIRDFLESLPPYLPKIAIDTMTGEEK